MPQESNIRTTARYRVRDTVCGLFKTAAKRADATQAAQLHHQEKHCPEIRIHDTMAMYGSPQEWDHEGNVTSTKPTKEEAFGA